MLIGSGVGLAIGGIITLITQRGGPPQQVGPTVVRLLLRIGIGVALAVAMGAANGVIRALLMFVLLAAAFVSIATMLRRAPLKVVRRVAMGAGVGFVVGAITSLLLPDSGSATSGADLVRVECATCQDLTEVTLVENGLRLSFSSAPRPIVYLWNQADPFDPLTVSPDGSITAAAQSDTWDLDQLRIAVDDDSITVIVGPSPGLAVSTRTGERVPSAGYVSPAGATPTDSATPADSATQSLYSTLAPDSQRLWTLLGHGRPASAYTAWLPPQPESVEASISASELCASNVCVSWQPDLWMAGLSAGSVEQVSGRDLGGVPGRCFAVSATAMPDGEWCFDDTGELGYLDNRGDDLILVRGGR